MFVYLSGSEKGKTRIFSQDHVTIGSTDSCDLKLVPEEGGDFPEGLLADVFDDEGIYYLVPNHSPERLPITVNGAIPDQIEVSGGYTLHDGDSVHFGNGLSSASVLFQIMPQNFAAAQLARQNHSVAERVNTQPVHPLTATLFVKELTASLWAEIPRKAKTIALTTAVAAVVVALGLAGFALVSFYRNAVHIERLREQFEKDQAARDQYQDTIRKQQEEIERLRETTNQTMRFAQTIAERYSPGVCLIVGSYTFAEQGSGRLLRYNAADDANSDPVDESGNLLASVDGAGPAVEFDYTGTGFVVAENVIATNRHVVRPWIADARAQIIMRQGGGFRVQLNSLTAFFPSTKKRFDLKEISSAKLADVALCRFDAGDSAIPILPMSTETLQTVIGEPVVLLGYPTGVDGMLQRADEIERREIQRQDGHSYEAIAEALSERGLIRPLTTTGTVSDALPTRIVHSAQTTEGGSGSPIFDRDGKAIAVNSAILVTADGGQSFGGSNFGVPIKAVRDLLDDYNSARTKETRTSANR